MDVLEAPKNLVEEVADMVVAQLLAFEQLVQVCFHQVLNNIAEDGSGTPPGGGSARHWVKKNKLRPER